MMGERGAAARLRSPGRRRASATRGSARRATAAALAGALLLPLGAAAVEKPGAAKPAKTPEQSAPLPPSRPEELGGKAPAPSSPAAAETGAAKVETPPKGPASVDPSACLDRLAKLGVKVEPMPPIVAGQCGAEHPFVLSTLPDGVDAAPDAQVGCPVAEALSRWVLEAVEPEAQKHLGVPLTKLLIGTSYECRGRNRDPNAKLSEHAFANAVDVMGFAFQKGPDLAVTARGEDTPEGRFQAAVRGRACAYFSTVLGPGSDAAHADHLHLDLRERKGGYRLCQ